MASLRERVQQQGTPLIDDDGSAQVRVTFAWLGEAPAPTIHGDFNYWQAGIALEQVEPGVWTYTHDFPRDAYIEYGFFYAYDIDERVPDPYNPRVIWNGVDAVNHYAAMPDYQQTDLIRRGAGVTRGKVSEHWFETRFGWDTHRKLYLYHPPTDEPTPLVVVWDGGDYLRRGYLNIIVDNLIAQKRIRPVALAMIDNGQRTRYLEYMQNEAVVWTAAEGLIPFAAEHLNLIDAAEQPGIHGVLGSSMGGLISLYTSLRCPTVFGRIVCQSGAFWSDQADFDDMLIVNLIKNNPVPPINIWQDCGTIEWLITGNRWMHDLLTGRGYNVTYREYNGGHNHTMWMDNTWRGLELLYPPVEA